MRRLVIAPLLGALALGFAVFLFVTAGATLPSGAAPNTHPTPTSAAPLSQAALIHRWFSQPSAHQGEIPTLIAPLRAAAAGAAPQATPGTVAAGPLAADVFNHDTVGLPQNEESVTVCGHAVLGGTNDFRGLLLTPPQEPATGWHLSSDGGRTVRNEGLLPPVTVAGQPVLTVGDPVDVAGQGCSLYAGSVAVNPAERIDAIVAYRSRPDTLASCPGGTDAAACWPTRRAVATAALPHFLDKEWMAVGHSGQAGEVVWVSFTDFILDPTTDRELSSSIKAVRCNPTLTTCTDPILVSGSDQRTQFSDVTVGPDGRTYLSWIDFQGSEETGLSMVLKLRVAPPASTQFGPTRIVATEPEPMIHFLHANSYIAGGFTIPKNDVKMVHGHPRLFVVWESCLTRLFGVCEEPRINLARSDDFGARWTRTVLSHGGDNYYPTISEDRGGPTLAVAWYTNRHDQVFHNRQDVELASVDPSTGTVVNRQRLTPVSNETEADPFLRGLFIGDYFEVFAQRGVAYVHYNANYRSVRVLGQGVPIPQQDNYLTKAHL